MLLTNCFQQRKFERDRVDLITTARYNIFIPLSYFISQLINYQNTHRVGAVTPEHVLYTVKNAEGEIEQRKIPTNFVLWSTGISMNPFTQRLTDILPNQVHKKAVEVDAHLRVKGAPLGDIYAIGDCSTVRRSIFSV
jgi:NADH dehydrogenase FAD-containing subunit